MKKSSTHRNSSSSINQQKSPYSGQPQVQNFVDGSQSSRSTSNNLKSTSQNHIHMQWTPERSGTSSSLTGSTGFAGTQSIGLHNQQQQNHQQSLSQQVYLVTQMANNGGAQPSSSSKINQNQSQILNSSSFAALTQQFQQQQQHQNRSPLIKDTTNTSYVNDVSMDRSQQMQKNHINSSISPVRQSNLQNSQNAQFYPNQSQNISRNQSHRSSSSTSFVNMLNKSGPINQNNGTALGQNNDGLSFKEREKKYGEKIKSLKSENKKLLGLLRDSEKLFYQKLQETKKESQNLSAIFKQLWPLIKNKVKDPTLLLKTVNGLSSSDEQENQISHNNQQNKLQIEDLEHKLLFSRQREKEMKDQLDRENLLRLTAEMKVEKLRVKLLESQAYQQTMKSYMHDSKGAQTYRMTSSSSRLNAKSGDNSTKPSTNIKENSDEPMPSFMKALHCYSSDTQSLDEENGFLNETFSKSSGNIIEERTRFSDISSKSLNKIKNRVTDHAITEDEQQAMLLESFGDHSNSQKFQEASKNKSRDNSSSFGNKVMDLKAQMNQKMIQGGKSHKKSDTNLLKNVQYSQSQLLEASMNNQISTSFLQAKGKSQIIDDDSSLASMIISNNNHSNILTSDQLLALQLQQSRKSHLQQQQMLNQNQNAIKSFLIQQQINSKNEKSRSLSPFQKAI